MASPLPLKPVNEKEVLLNRFKGVTDLDKVGLHLGGGGFSQVFRVKDLKTRQTLAMKVSGGGTFVAEPGKEDEFSNLEVAIREIRVMRKLTTCSGKGKQFCAQILDWQFLENRIAIFFPCYPISVNDLMNDLERRHFVYEDVVAIAFQIVHAVKFLHENGVTHMDIKPHNCMLVCADYKFETLMGNKEAFEQECIRLRNPEIKLIDFGSCLTLEDKGKNYFVGVTDEYVAPEFLLKNTTSSAYDIWSVGCTILELYTGNPLFPVCPDDVHLVVIEKVIGKIPERLTQNYELPKMTDRMIKVAKGHCTLAELISWGPKDRIYLYELLKMHLLKIDPEERTSMSKVLDHSFFNFQFSIRPLVQPTESWQTPEIIGYVSTAGR